MSLPIQLLSTDFDGTLHAEFENPPVPEDLQHLIASLQANGLKWVINTGRDLSSLMETLGRAQLSIWPDYIVTVEREIHVRNELEYLPLQEWNRSCDLAHGELFSRVRPDVPQLAEWIQARFRATVYEDPYSPFCLIAGNNGDADLIYAYLQGLLHPGARPCHCPQRCLCAVQPQRLQQRFRFRRSSPAFGDRPRQDRRGGRSPQRFADAFDAVCAVAHCAGQCGFGGQRRRSAPARACE